MFSVRSVCDISLQFQAMTGKQTQTDPKVKLKLFILIKPLQLKKRKKENLPLDSPDSVPETTDFCAKALSSVSLGPAHFFFSGTEGLLLPSPLPAPSPSFFSRLLNNVSLGPPHFFFSGGLGLVSPPSETGCLTT